MVYNETTVFLAKRAAENKDATLDFGLYLRQFNTLYGWMFEDDEIADELEAALADDIIEIEEKRFSKYGDSIATKIESPETLLREFSAIAFLLARNSFERHKVYTLANWLRVPVKGLIDTKNLFFTEEQLQEPKISRMVEETKLDLDYACGDGREMSRRMKKYLDEKGKA